MFFTLGTSSEIPLYYLTAMQKIMRTALKHLFIVLTYIVLHTNNYS